MTMNGVPIVILTPPPIKLVLHVPAHEATDVGLGLQAVEYAYLSEKYRISAIATSIVRASGASCARRRTRTSR